MTSNRPFELYVAGRLINRYETFVEASRVLKHYPEEVTAQIFKVVPTVDLQLVHEQGGI